MISLVKVEEADAFLQRVKEAYGPYQGMSKAEVEQNAFITRPGTGAGGMSLLPQKCGPVGAKSRARRMPRCSVVRGK